MSSNQNGGGGPPPGLHFLKALGHAALAVGHVAFGGKDGQEDEDEVSRPRKRKRFKFSGLGGAGGPPGAGKKGGCCKGSRR